MTPLSRRDFLKLGLLGTVGLAFDWRRTASDPFVTLGRVTRQYLRVHLYPSGEARQIGWLGFDEIVKIYDSVLGRDGRWWQAIGSGYVQSAEIQPVESRTNPVVTRIWPAGLIGEITVPYVDALRKPESTGSVFVRLYYSSAYWVRDVTFEASGQAWYKLYDERLGVHYFVPAPVVRIVPADELTPLTPGVEAKRLVVSLRRQRLTAFEGQAEVFSTLVSAGRIFMAADGITIRSWTPSGVYKVERKRPSRHMGFGEAAGSDYELPGVPWVSYFHWKGYSFHGTWWHNDFGRPRSAGCVNMRPEEARWLFRWSRPTPLPDQELTVGEGTAVEVTDD